MPPSSRHPPAFVPTLTQVVKSAQPQGQATDRPVMLTEQGIHKLTHQLIAQVDLNLERRLREALTRVVLEHTQTLLPALRAQVQVAVQDTVSEALDSVRAGFSGGESTPRAPISTPGDAPGLVGARKATATDAAIAKPSTPAMSDQSAVITPPPRHTSPS